MLWAARGKRQGGQLLRIRPLAAVNSGVLGTVLVERTQSFTLEQSMGFGLGRGMGYLLAVMLVTEADLRLRSEAIPEAFRGRPIPLIYIGVLALAIYGFTGHSVIRCGVQEKATIMAKYNKVKRYHRSFYSPGMWVKKAVGIIVLVAVVLVVGRLAAPHVLDRATYTWYTVVRNCDLSASSETPASSAAASSEATAEPAASSKVRADSEPEPAAPAGVIIKGTWGVLDTAAAKDEASPRAAARQLAQQGEAYAVVTLKDSAGNILYPYQVAAAAGSIEGASLEPALIHSVIKENGLVPLAKLAAFRDTIAARADRNMAIGYTGQAYLRLDNKASAGDNPWLNP